MCTELYRSSERKVSSRGTCGISELPPAIGIESRRRPRLGRGRHFSLLGTSENGAPRTIVAGPVRSVSREPSGLARVLSAPTAGGRSPRGRFGLVEVAAGRLGECAHDLACRACSWRRRRWSLSTSRYGASPESWGGQQAFQDPRPGGQGCRCAPGCCRP